ncbi:MAG: TonB-dependent receptor [Allosphingosinicella sp.]|uniref:TonB-dependent receptor n=1 Tax=Allosphingosinicella sp. TaxID=2823234 RepID=UPI003949EFDB
MLHRLALLPLLVFPAAAAQAQQAGENVIIVTGRGLGEAPGEAVYGTVTIGRERLDLSSSNRLEEVLRDVPGFQLFRRSDARSANPTSQGATLRALGGNASSRALLILDGVPQTDPFGGWISWPAYNPRRLGEVRVVRGGGTGAAGPGALAGTIELESASPQDLRGIAASLAAGSRGGVDGSASAGWDLGRGFLTAGASYATGDGFIPIVEEQRGPADRPSPYEQASFAIRAVAPLARDIELQAGGLAFHDSRERGTAFSDIRTDGLDASLRLVGSGALPWSALAYVQTRSFYNSFASVSPGRAAANRTAEQYEVPSTGLGARIELRPRLGPAELRIGGDWRETSGVTRERFNFQNGVGTRGREAGGRTRTVGAFGEASFEAGAFVLSGGARIDRWWIEDGRLEERIFATSEQITDTHFADRSGWEPTARGGVAWRPAADLTLRVAAYLGWRLPTLNELYRPFRVGPDATAANADLRPERLRGAEAGVEWRPLPAARIGVTLFTNRLENPIANVTLAQGPGVFPGVGFVSAAGEYRQRQNLEAIDSRGIEINGSIALGRFSLSAGYSFADAEVVASGPAAPLDGLRPAQTPRHSAAATLAWSPHDGAQASFSARYVDTQFEDDLNRQSLDDALTFDAALLWPLSRNLSVETRGENLTDERVEAGISSDGTIERATPRTLWIGLRIRG